MKRTTLAVTLAATLAIAAVGIAAATSTYRSTWAPGHHTGSVTISAFQRSFHPTVAQRRQRAEIRREFRKAPRESAVASTAYGSARPVTIAGTQQDAWIAPDASGGACTFIDDPLGGYGSSCATPDAIGNGQAATILLVGDGSPLAGKALVAVVEPDNATPPVVHHADGSADNLPVANNLATGLVSPGDTIYSQGNRIAVPQPHHHVCAPPQGGDTFRRCT